MINLKTISTIFAKAESMKCNTTISIHTLKQSSRSVDLCNTGWTASYIMWFMYRAHGILSLTRFPAHGRMSLSQWSAHLLNDIMPCAGKRVNDIMPCARRYRPGPIRFHERDTASKSTAIPKGHAKAWQKWEFLIYVLQSRNRVCTPVSLHHIFIVLDGSRIIIMRCNNKSNWYMYEKSLKTTSMMYNILYDYVYPEHIFFLHVYTCSAAITNLTALLYRVSKKLSGTLDFLLLWYSKIIFFIVSV